MSVPLSVLRWQEKQGLHLFASYIKDFRYSARKSKVEVISREETKYILQNEDSIRQKLTKLEDQAFDYWIVALLLAPRVSDMNSWTQSNLISDGDQYWLNYSTQKTAEDLSVPVPPQAKKIFDKNLMKYKKLLPPVKFTTVISYRIKQIARKMGIFDYEFTRTRTKGGQSVEVTIPRWQSLSIHKMRGSAITNMLDSKVPEHIVRAFSGHVADSKAFGDYVDQHKSSKMEAMKAYQQSINTKEEENIKPLKKSVNQ
jgi:integrase